MMQVEGGCHCGAVRFQAQVKEPVELLACNCSICSMTGFVHLIVPHSDLALLGSQNNLAAYRFGTGKAEHLFCKVCGIKSFYQPRSHPGSWSLNWNCIDGKERIDHRIVRFDGQNWEAAHDRLKDRKSTTNRIPFTGE